MGPLGVVGFKPRVRDRAHVLERVEEMSIEDFLAKRSVEALDEGVLIGLARLDVAEADALGGAPRHEGLSDEFRTIVDAQAGRAPIETREVVEHADDARAGDRRPNLDAQSFTVALVDDRERPERTAVVERVCHEVERPRDIQLGGGAQRLPEPRGQSPLRPARQVQAEGAVHAVHPLVIPAMASPAQPMKTLPETPATMV